MLFIFHKNAVSIRCSTKRQVNRLYEESIKIQYHVRKTEQWYCCMVPKFTVLIVFLFKCHKLQNLVAAIYNLKISKKRNMLDRHPEAKQYVINVICLILYLVTNLPNKVKFTHLN